MSFANASCPKCKKNLNTRCVEEEIEWNSITPYRAACPHCGQRIVIYVEVIYRIETTVSVDRKWSEDCDDETELILEEPTL